jgi:hypothetical protein
MKNPTVFKGKIITKIQKKEVFHLKVFFKKTLGQKSSDLPESFLT